MKPIFPEEILRSHVSVLGMTGSGKTTTGKLLIEQVSKDDRVCILDPIKSDWWGITSSADGKHAGLPFTILGGPRQHVPLHSGAGAAIGEIVARGDLRHSIIDMADFEPGGLQRFFVDFAHKLMQRMRGVLYLVIEEAHEFAPKERAGFGNENASIHYAKKLATAGRSKGIRLVVLTQATQSLHNAVLGSCNTMIAHQFTQPAQQKPVVDWLKANADKEHAEAIAQSLSKLKTGTGWICNASAGIFTRCEFPKARTYDNTATPTSSSGEHDVRTAAVDVDALRAAIGEAVKVAEENDPKLLKARIAQLEKAARAAPAPAVDPAAIEQAQTAGHDSGFRAGFEAGYGAALNVFRDRLDPETARQSLAGLQTFLAILSTALTEHPPAPPKAPTGALRLPIPRYFVDSPARSGPDPAPPSLRDGSAPHKPARDTVRPAEASGRGAAGLDRVARTLLGVLAQFHPATCSRDQLSILSGYSIKSSTFANALSTIRTLRLASGRGELRASEHLIA